MSGRSRSIKHKPNFFMRLFTALTRAFTKQEKIDNTYREESCTRGYYTRGYIQNDNLKITSFGTISKPSDYYFIYQNDEQFRTTIDQLVYKVTSLNWYIHDVDESLGISKLKNRRINKYIERTFEHLDIERIKTEGLLYSFIQGFTVFQILYKNDGEIDETTGLIEIEDIVMRDSDKFFFKMADGQIVLKYINETGKEEDVNPIEYIVYVNNYSSIRPFGESEIGISGLKWYWVGKNVLQYWLKTQERKGDPPYVLKTADFSKFDTPPVQPNERTKNAFVDQLAAEAGVAGVIKVPLGLDLSILNSDTNNASFAEMMKYRNDAINKQILNSTITTENQGNTGSQALGRIHENSTEAKIEAKSKQDESFFNALIQTIVDINFRMESENLSYPEYRIEYRRKTIDTDKIKAGLDIVNINPNTVLVAELMQNAGYSTDHIDPSFTFGDLPKEESENTQNEIRSVI